MKQKNYEAKIGFRDRYTGTDYETIIFSARNKKEAERIARERGNALAYKYCPDSFFVDYVMEVS